MWVPVKHALFEIVVIIKNTFSKLSAKFNEANFIK